MDNHAAMPSAEMKSEGAPKDGEQSQATAATATPQILHIDNREALSTAFHSRHPVLMHLNADTTWLLSLPRRVEQARLGEQEEAGEEEEADDAGAAQQGSPETQPMPANRASRGMTSDCDPKPGRRRFNILIDPWLQGPQSDVAGWFSTQWHVVAPSVASVAELNERLREAEAAGEGSSPATTTPPAAASPAERDVRGGPRGNSDPQEHPRRWFIDAVALSHEFTDHCHKATLCQLPPSTPVVAPDKAARLVRGWRHFETVVDTPPFDPSTAATGSWREELGRGARDAGLPAWLRVGRVVSPGNSLYYHSAIMVAWDDGGEDDGEGGEQGANAATDGDGVTATGRPLGHQARTPRTKAALYSPHGIRSSDLAAMRRGSGAADAADAAATGAAAGVGSIETVALLHGLDDVRMSWLGGAAATGKSLLASLGTLKQLNLGGANGREAARACAARYWVATHDEDKKGGGIIAPLLRRTRYSLLGEAAENGDGEGAATVTPEAASRRRIAVLDQTTRFVELGSGDTLILE